MKILSRKYLMNSEDIGKLKVIKIEWNRLNSSINLVHWDWNKWILDIMFKCISYKLGMNCTSKNKFVTWDR